MKKFAMLVTFGVAALTGFSAVGQNVVQPTSPTGIDHAMLFKSFVQDARYCTVSAAANGQLVWPSQVSDPAATCPDAFAWTQYLGAIKQEFWNWGIDQTIWPSNPWPICSGNNGPNCCPADILGNPGPTPNEHCPYNRAAFDPVPPLPLHPNGVPSGVLISHRGAHKKTFVEDLDPGRVLRRVEVEIVFRNPAMVEGIFKNDLYTREGLGARTRAANAAMGQGDIGRAQALEVRLKTDATMVKADFIHQDVMLGLGLIRQLDAGGVPNDPDYPYLTVFMTGAKIKLIDGSEYDPSGYYYMVAMTNSSKALPTWHWYAMEHVKNRGRCDYIGCNDSFGFAVNKVQANGATYTGHFVPPQQQLQNDVSAAGPAFNANDAIFLNGRIYAPDAYGEKITDPLDALFEAMGVATDRVDQDPKVISITDPQWRNYRLKGTQTAFTTSQGVPTGMGATVTEGGFVNSASCLTCHSQASTDQNGAPGFGGSVGGTYQLNLFGFGQTARGAPDPDWFFYPGGQAPYAAVQTDFMWGVLNASCVKPGPQPGGPCASYPDAPTILD